MVKITNKSVFNSGCDLIVNTINCHGVMGAGIALEFSLRYPQMFNQYKYDCEKGIVKTGKTYLYCENGQKILNFPTKGNEPCSPSLIKYIEEGLKYFSKHYKEYNKTSVAFPPLGCTNGKLNFDEVVKPLMLNVLENIDDLEILICLNKMPLEGLEKQMTEKLKTLEARTFKECFSNDEDYLKFCDGFKNIDRFSQLGSKKYLPTENVYRNIWQLVYGIVKGDTNYEI